MINRERIVNTFCRLVDIESPSFGEQKLASYLSEVMSSLGFEVREDGAAGEIGGNSGNLICDMRGTVEGPVMSFCCHMDRFGPGKVVDPVIREEHVESRGNTVLGADDAAGIAVIIEVLRLVKEENILHLPLRVFFTVAEEEGMQGARELPDSVLSATDFCYVLDGEGPVGNVITSSPYTYKINAEIQVDHGVKGVKIASRALSRMDLQDTRGNRVAHVEVARGGMARDIGPRMVELAGKVQSIRQEIVTRKLSHLRQVISSAADKYGGEVKFDTERLYPGYYFPPESRILRLLRQAGKVKFRRSEDGSDANILNARGLPAVNLAVAVENTHTSGERIVIEDLVRLAELVVSIIKTGADY
ncbi:MAG: M20/M25/M40 family metallo-hydrolase [Halanaerobiaceae bacterium]